jgi:hypothetical protein
MAKDPKDNNCNCMKENSKCQWGHWHFSPSGGECRNPYLAKCGGEAQHLEKLGIWSPPGLPNVQSSIAGRKTPRLGLFLVSLKSLETLISKMASHWPFGHLSPKLWAKEGLGVKLAIWLPTTKSQESTSFQFSIQECNTSLERSSQELQLQF